MSLSNLSFSFDADLVKFSLQDSFSFQQNLVSENWQYFWDLSLFSSLS